MKNIALLLLLSVALVAEVIDDAAFNRYLADGKQEELEKIIEANVKGKNPHPDEVYFYLVLERSRFDTTVIPRVLPFIQDKISKERREALTLISNIDAGRDVDYSFLKLTKMAAEATDNSILWLGCIACRQLRQNEKGEELYGKLITKWTPGPMLLHQTYANILDGLGRPLDALVHRELAIKIKETSWNLDGYGNTLTALGRFAGGEEAYRRSLAIKETPSAYCNLGRNLIMQEKFAEAEVALRKSVELDGKDSSNHAYLASALTGQKKYDQAEVEFKAALAMDGTPTWTYSAYVRLLRTVGREAEAKVIEAEAKSIESGVNKAP